MRKKTSKDPGFKIVVHHNPTPENEKRVMAALRLLMAEGERILAGSSDASVPPKDGEDQAGQDGGGRLGEIAPQPQIPTK
jgi:hypothetical protein